MQSFANINPFENFRIYSRENQQCNCTSRVDSDQSKHPHQSDQSLPCPHEECLGITYSEESDQTVVYGSAHTYFVGCHICRVNAVLPRVMAV